MVQTHLRNIVEESVCVWWDVWGWSRGEGWGLAGGSVAPGVLWGTVG